MLNVDKLDNKEKVLLYKYLYGSERLQDLIPPDDEYEFVLKTLKSSDDEKKIHWTQVTFEMVKDIMEKAGLDTTILSIEEDKERNNIREDIVEYESHWRTPRSIKMIETPADLLSYVKSFHQASYNGELLMSLKMDGWNIRVYYHPSSPQPVLVTTRGRGGNTLDCTEVLAHLLPKVTTPVPFLVKGELMLDKTVLPYLRVKYNRPFKNSRNSLSSIVHNTIDVDEIKSKIKVFAFDIEFLDTAYTTRIETFEALKQIGYDVPPYAPTDIAKYNVTFEGLENYYKGKFRQRWECDGVVFSPNIKTDGVIVKEDFVEDDMIAVKMGTWSKRFYHATVKDILIPPSSGGAYREPVAIITPTEAGTRIIQRVPLINIARAKCGAGLTPVDIGDEIIFSYHSNQVVKFRGKDGKILF